MTHRRLTVIGIAGYARSGKDTVGQWLVTEHGFTQLSFAEPLKRCAVALDPLVEGNPENPGELWALSALIETHGWEVAKNILPESPWSVRSILQRMGTEVGRNILGQDIWVEAAMKHIYETHEKGGRYVFTDVRFPNEADAIARVGHVVRVHRPGFGPVSDHPSETALDAYDYDTRLSNEGDLGFLFNQASVKLTLLGAL